MQKTKIEWCDYSINPVKGLCPVGCSYCYARRLYKRFKWNPELYRDVLAFMGIEKLKPSRIFVGSTMELFGEWIEPNWMLDIFDIVKRFPQHTFIFLTKQPQNLIKWNPFPENVWLGVSVYNDKMLDVAVDKLEDIQAKVKFISFEPLLEKLTLSLDYAFYYSGISWAIIGQITPVRKATMPKIEWIKEIVEAADKAGVPVFLKNNLRELLCCGATPWAWQTNSGMLRQEFPNP